MHGIYDQLIPVGIDVFGPVPAPNPQIAKTSVGFWRFPPDAPGGRNGAWNVTWPLGVGNSARRKSLSDTGAHDDCRRSRAAPEHRCVHRNNGAILGSANREVALRAKFGFTIPNSRSAKRKSA